jgi:hypothetical protein
MVARRYIGLLNPETHFMELRPMREKLIWMAGQWAPTSWEYAELHKPVLALDACAEAVLRRPPLLRHPAPHHQRRPPGWPPGWRSDPTLPFLGRVVRRRRTGWGAVVAPQTSPSCSTAPHPVASRRPSPGGEGMWVRRPNRGMSNRSSNTPR